MKQSDIKIPKTFRPEKDLDKKTNQLIDEVNKIPNENETDGNMENMITAEEIEDLLELRDEHRSNPPGINANL